MISEKQVLILEALGRYKYLTASQVVDLGITASTNTARQYMVFLSNEKLKLTKKMSYRGAVMDNNDSFKYVKFESMNFLDSKGVEFLQDRGFDNVKHPKKQVLEFSNDYLHRFFMVSTCISFDQYTTKQNSKKPFFKIDFHNQETSIKIDDKLTIKPDIIAGFDGKFYIIEVWAGKEVGYITSKLRKVFTGVASGKVSEFLDYDKAPKILNIFKYKTVMDKVKAELLDDNYFQNGINKGVFCFALFDDIKQNFDNWQDIRGQRIDL